MLLNTSFNLAGAPIVESPYDAMVTYLTSGIDVLVMERFYVDKKVPLRLQPRPDSKTTDQTSPLLPRLRTIHTTV